MPIEFIKTLQYRHRVTGDDINQYPRQSGLKFFFACVLGAFMFLAIAVKI
ncbi:hypothetical protein YP72344_24560 [Yersinia pseudotuberculosis]|nr:hypothetical protein DJ55_267 [Yersinia pseudotuberculosis]BCU90961.1 hypothetical protein YP72344_24560 [Yersinia pseudotuberculosis]CFQ49028.1 Uncharacterised protein [Yersinia similis]